MSVRLLVKTYGVRDVKDIISRRILERFREEGIELAANTVELVRVPRVEVRTTGPFAAAEDSRPADH
jgi:small-conductance mechanosensitive channel